ncbi:VOC family protein [Salisediminibacterium beveridgei]|uniref:Glyoxalase n=1 Tax=Salisediminibacterium beveridgei TaxID=632773 RepID=A0A1D7QYY0_9BACI|nr:VOC family protein [Salisediminibacterium beveridgei]AOM84226.1 glyoxalase [Salisediminibacterium beveridgei]
MHELKGLHHVTAITSSAEKNYDFFTYVLGMRLVKKSINQDDIHTYHLFFADDEGSPGTDMTFFDFPGIPKGTHGTNEFYRTSFRIPSDEALSYWEKRFNRLQVRHEGIQEVLGKKVLPFEDFDEQKYQLISDEGHQGAAGGTPWKKGPIPDEFAITGLGPMVTRVKDIGIFDKMITELMGFTLDKQEDNLRLYSVGEGGNGAQVITEHRDDLPNVQQGFGTVHHTAFRVEDKEALDHWTDRLNSYRFPNSGFVDRFYFKSLYARLAPNLLFEFATDGPGFMEDEPYETLGEKLALPPAFEAKRESIEKQVRPIDTVRSTKNIEKEYE